VRILLCNYEYPPLGGGGGIFTACLARELAKRHEVAVLTSQGLGTPADSVEDGVRVVRAPVFLRQHRATASLVSMASFMVDGTREGKKLLRQQSFDIINTHFALPSGPVGDALARFGGIPNVLTVHGGDIYDPSKFTSPHRHPLLKAWTRNLLGKANKVVGQSKNTLENVHKYYTSDLDSVRIPLGIDPPPVVSQDECGYKFDEDEVLLITIGRLVPRKASEQLITMMKTLKGTRAKLIIIGSGPEEKMLKAEVKSSGLKDQVLFTGFVTDEDKFRLLQRSDIYVSSSQHEGFGLVFLEAMASGLPVVCYDHGGQTDFLQNDRNGYVVSLNDLDGLRARCQQLIENHQLRNSIGRNNKELVKEFYIDNCAKLYENLFYETISQFSGEPVEKVYEYT
jgi:glycosyltransferase involved in cell wall biosynthesis